MFFPKDKFRCLSLAVLCCFLISSVALAENPKGHEMPTDEDLWEARQAGDLKEAARIKALTDEQSKVFWGGRADHDCVVESPVIRPPENEDAFFMPSNWGNDRTIVLGTTDNGISTDYDWDGNVYAVRCTTYGGTSNARIRVYKSTDEGNSWSYPYLCSFYVMGGASYSYPVVLTGTSGTPDRLYIFYLQSTGSGDIRLARYTLDGAFEGFYEVKVDSDTIDYFTACTNFGYGDRLMVAYERRRMGQSTSTLYTIVSTDKGETWGYQRTVTSDGSHPDMAYGYGGYVYLVYTKTGGADDEISFCRNTNYSMGVAWEEFDALTNDSFDDDYAKVAALHKTDQETQYVWVGYNHDWANSGNWDMRFAYSTNAGVHWSENHNLATHADYDEIACDLWVARKTAVSYVNICYLRTRWITLYNRSHDIYWGFTNTNAPSTWNDLEDIADHWGAFSYDGREVCQGTYPDLESGGGWSGVVYSGRTLLENFEGLYFDNRQWTDVEEEPGQETRPREFALADNYPNPFNPHTRIAYFLPRACQVKLEVFNILGQKIRTLVDEDQTAGNREVSWDGMNAAGEEVASGVYFYKLEADDFTQSKKMVLIR
jgi:hypothetical protein